MGKRFGRNQRRRARQEIERLEKLRGEDRRVISGLRDRVGEHRAFLEYVMGIVGPGSVINPDPEDIGLADDTDSFRMARSCHVREERALFLSEQQLQAVVVHALRTAVGKDKLRDALHFQVRLRSGEVRYALTDAAIAAMPLPALERLLHHHIAKQLAQQLVSALAD